MNNQVNTLNWFEIPVSDMPRAKKFYESVFQFSSETNTMMDTEMTYFPMEMGNGKLSGALEKGPRHQPSKVGSKVYMNCNPDMSPIIERINKAGGKVVMPKTSIGDAGFMAFFIDSEGNEIGLHSIE